MCDHGSYPVGKLLIEKANVLIAKNLILNWFNAVIKKSKPEQCSIETYFHSYFQFFNCVNRKVVVN